MAAHFPIPVPAGNATAWSDLRFWSSVGLADTGFLCALDTLRDEPAPFCSLAALAEWGESFVVAQSQAHAYVRQTLSWMSGFARGQQTVTRESASKTRQAARKAGLPVLGGGR